MSGYSIFGSVGGGGGSADETFTAETPIDAYKAVTVNSTGQAVLASSDNVAHQDRVVGITTTSGSVVTVKSSGSLTNAQWNWVVNNPVFLGLNGELTQQPFTGVITQQLGFAKTPTSIFVRVNHGVRRA